MDGSLTFIGTATTLIRCGGFTVLTDPNFLHRGERAYLGHGLVSRRRSEPALQPEQLPELDAVVLSHLHGDHWDRRARAGLDRTLPVVTTTHAAVKLKPQGFGNARGLASFESTELHRAGAVLRVTSLPATHARLPVKALLPPVMGSLIEVERRGEATFRIWLSGDTLVGGDLRAAAERVAQAGGADLGVLHLGGTRIGGVILVTMDDVQGVEALRLVRPAVTIPVHYDDYGVFRSPLQHFLDRADREQPDSRIVALRRGDTYRFDGSVEPSTAGRDVTDTRAPRGLVG